MICRRSASRRTGSSRSAPGWRASSSPRRNACGRPENPPARYSATWIRPGRARSASIERARTASASRAAASDADRVVAGQDLELFEELLERDEGRGVERVRHAGELEDELAAAARERAKVARVRLGAAGAFESPEGETLRGPGLGEPPAPPLRPLGELFFPRVVFLPAGLPGLLKLRDAPIERGEVPARAPADLRLTQGAGHGARAGRVGSATLRPLERQGSGGQAPRGEPRPRIRRRSSRGRRAPPGPGA